MKYGILLTGPGLGDDLILSSLPENYYRNTGEKLIEIGNHPIFNFNPFIDRSSKADVVFTTQQIQDQATRITRNPDGSDKIKVFSIPDRHRHFFNLKKAYLRRPRLYRFEELKTKQNKVTIHTQAKSLGGILSDEVMAAIVNNYKDYELVQIGGPNDKKMPNSLDKRGLGFWDTAFEIAESAIYIGVDSGMLHIASAYPKVRKKVVLNYIREEDFMTLSPLQTHAVWWEFNIESYCNYKYDCGAAMSFKDI